MEKYFCFGKNNYCTNVLCNEKCPHFNGSGGEYREAPKTNGDNIRSMSDEELVRLRYSGAPHCKSDNPKKCNRHDFVDGMSPCELCYYEWLQQPAEEGNHEM